MQTPNSAIVLRAKAELIRRAATAPTTGGEKTDRLLLEIAARLEREADELERANRRA